MLLSLSAKDRILRDDAALALWLRVLSEQSLLAYVKPWGKILPECRCKMDTRRGCVLSRSVGFTELTWVILISSSCFSSSFPWKRPSLLQGHIGTCLMPLFCVGQGLSVLSSLHARGVDIFLQGCLIDYQGNATQHQSLLQQWMIGIVASNDSCIKWNVQPSCT